MMIHIKGFGLVQKSRLSLITDPEQKESLWVINIIDTLGQLFVLEFETQEKADTYFCYLKGRLT